MQLEHFTIFILTISLINTNSNILTPISLQPTHGLNLSSVAKIWGKAEFLEIPWSMHQKKNNLNFRAFEKIATHKRTKSDENVVKQ